VAQGHLGKRSGKGFYDWPSATEAACAPTDDSLRRVISIAKSTAD